VALLPAVVIAASSVVRSIVFPLAGTYLLFMVMMLWSERERERARDAGRARPKTATPAHPALLVRHVVVTVVAGYASFLVFVCGYYFLVARQSHHFLEQAVSGGAFLAFVVALPAFLLLGLLERHR
jgi:threonine/homoserine/homoserine lactone efflux protein